ncbi:MAG: type II toxin-antitoxin system VapC family toxin [Thermoleophilia bacterium]|nr:type II toxin-antitoxin system VapC family toxin [Thermoleophilia bacterium]GIK78470.1 MAG: ribonuclease VapC [Actinomycetes bacterium]
MGCGARARLTVLLDTHVWFWWCASPWRLSDRAATAIDSAGTILVSAVSCWELGMLAAKGRIAFDRPIETWVRQALARPGLRALPLGPRAATLAGTLEPAEFHGDPADRMIYASARDEGAVLVTRDRLLRDFDPRGTLW